MKREGLGDWRQEELADGSKILRQTILFFLGLALAGGTFLYALLHAAKGVHPLIE